MVSSAPDPFSSVVLRLGVVGARWEERYAEALLGLDVKPKHVALLASLRSVTSRSQLELADRMGVGPSLVVALADHLEAKGAIGRERDPADRRRQRLILTGQGNELLDRCSSLLEELDRELVAQIRPYQDGLRAALDILGTPWGLTSINATLTGEIDAVSEG
ncbi:MarR family winged helix-turn-helix transcriptional regulator [Cryobacterium sp. GrIS_2_6]|uniref:MarR family winged helix-turn-helix transcriptional regulator n=1 Tax=Cryobacterium sp. GrIS_2_6 TaxID=3162785 RepID=UPI002DFEC00F|nr:DNA-binding MarR family transcriptional regulator [Cryobacterium psychrotolerans]